MNLGKKGAVSQTFTDGSFAIWCEADHQLYHYHLERGQSTQPQGAHLTFWVDEGGVSRYELAAQDATS
jgi:hypothetical protein